MRFLISLVVLLGGCSATAQDVGQFKSPTSTLENIRPVNQADELRWAPVLRRHAIAQKPRPIPKPEAKQKIEVKPEPEKIEVKALDARCGSLGKYARLIAVLKENGLPRENLGKAVPEQGDNGFPQVEIQADIYNRKLTPDQHEKRVVDFCNDVGYANLTQKLRDEEAARKKP